MTANPKSQIPNPTPQSFSEWLEARAQTASSLLCVGLDPRRESAASCRDECFRLIDATAEFACAFKANSAFFEAHGAEGLAALRQVIARVPDGIPVILDAKRGDIADTAEAYARAAFETLGAHAVTVSPYLGGEAIAPFLARPERGAFVLCKTSNPGAGEFQSLNTFPSPSGRGAGGEGRPLFEIVAERAAQWNTRDNVGLVVGATDPAAIARARVLAPDLWFLVPGVGAQGGELQAALTAGLRPDGLGLLINVSRSLARANDPHAEAKRLREQIADWRLPIVDLKSPISNQQSPISNPLAHALHAAGCVRFGPFTLKSGETSPVYIDLRRLVSHPPILARVARAYAETLRGLSFDRLAGIPYAGLPIATAVALEMDRPLVYPRRETKDYGTRAAIEGDYAPGETVAVIDDLATTGGTKIETIQKLEAAGLIVRDIVVLIDREQGAREILAAGGYRLHAVFTLSELLAEWQRIGAITPAQFDEVLNFLKQGDVGSRKFEV